MTRLVVDTGVVMRTRDGVELAADVYRFDDGARRPVLLHRTPYDRANPVLVSSIVVDPMWLARYTGDELTETVRIAGPARLTVFLASSAEDTDLVATLVDVDPAGCAVNVSEGALRTRYRRGGHADWLVPGRVTELVVEPHHAAHGFAPGHRIRLEVTSSNFPRLSRNLNSRVLPERGTVDDVTVAEQTVYHDARYPSRLSLHTVSAG